MLSEKWVFNGVIYSYVCGASVLCFGHEIDCVRSGDVDFQGRLLLVANGLVIFGGLVIVKPML